MNILSLTMVKNEQDIIEPFIRHHARLVDNLIVMDNGSVDDTLQIMRACAAELPNVVVTQSNDTHYLQSERMTAMLQEWQAQFCADFVLPLDVDEFIGTNSREELESV